MSFCFAWVGCITCETIVRMGQQSDHYYIGAKQLRKPAAGRSQRKDYYKKNTD